jgi:hypothetical protein
MPDGAHVLPPLPGGWRSLPFVDLDGTSWPLPFAAQILEIPLRDLRKRVKEEGLEPSGVIRMREYRSQGRQPRAYPAAELIRIAEEMEFPGSPDRKFPDSPDSV